MSHICICIPKMPINYFEIFPCTSFISLHSIKHFRRLPRGLYISSDDHSKIIYFHAGVRSGVARWQSGRTRGKKIDDWRVVKHSENEPRSIKVAQLVQWGGAPAALARDTELCSHAKRAACGAPCTSLASPSLLAPPPSTPSPCSLFTANPRATRFLLPYVRFEPRCTRFVAHMQRPLPVVSLETRPREAGSRLRTVPAQRAWLRVH